MNSIIYLTIYIIGCILSFGRVYASFYKIDEEYFIKYGLKPRKFGENDLSIILCIIITTLCSWIGFIIGIIIYFELDEKYFLKFSYKKIKN